MDDNTPKATSTELLALSFKNLESLGGETSTIDPNELAEALQVSEAPENLPPPLPSTSSRLVTQSPEEAAEFPSQSALYEERVSLDSTTMEEMRKGFLRKESEEASAPDETPAPAEVSETPDPTEEPPPQKRRGPLKWLFARKTKGFSG